MCEMTLGMITAALTAGAWDVPFMPVPPIPGTGYVDEGWPAGRRSHATSEFGACDVVAAIVPDVAFVHVDLADDQGNGVVRGPVGEVVVAAQASDVVILVAEEVADAETVRGAGITVPGLLTTAVVLRPGAVAPDGAVGRYDRDVQAYEDYVSRARSPEGFAAWREELQST